MNKQEEGWWKTMNTLAEYTNEVEKVLSRKYMLTLQDVDCEELIKDCYEHDDSPEQAVESLAEREDLAAIWATT